MKKALVGFLILAVGAGAFAKGESEGGGLKFGGALKTGIQFQADNAEKGGKKVHDPSIQMYNDDADEETRLDLDASYTQDNYGVVLRLRTNTVISGPQVQVNQAYAWADFLNDIINMKVGLIDDSVWNTGGDEDFHYSTGAGLRLEVKPIDGLNLGVFLNGPTGDEKTPFYKTGKEIFGSTVEHFFLETAFGVSYESDLFNVAAGLKLDGKGDGLTTDIFYDFPTKLSKEEGGGYTSEKEPILYTDKTDADKGLGAYVGFGINAIEPLTAIVEARFNNLGGYADYGWIWINETLGYAITEPLEVGLVMHQRLFGADNYFATVILGDNKKSVSPYLTFKPYVSYALTDKWTIGLDIPVGFWPDIIDYDIGVKPKISYKVGENASINAFYLFDLMQPVKNFGTSEDPDSVMTNTVQVDFIWTF